MSRAADLSKQLSAGVALGGAALLVAIHGILADGDRIAKLDVRNA